MFTTGEVEQILDWAKTRRRYVRRT